MKEAHGTATDVFGSMLERQAQVDRIKGVLAMLKRYESLFRLPTRIRCTNIMLHSKFRPLSVYPDRHDSGGVGHMHTGEMSGTAVAALDFVSFLKSRPALECQPASVH